MCIIFGCFGGRPSEKLLEEGERRNDDGAGVAWVEGDMVRWEKGLDLKEVIRFVHQDKMPFPFVVHFRTATHGGAIPELTHPFPLTKSVNLDLGGKAKGVLFHNGVWRKWDDMVLASALGRGAELPDGPWSDSRGLAYIIAHHGEGFLRVGGTEGGRVALLYARKKQPIKFWGDWSHEYDNVGFWTSQAISCSVYTKSGKEEARQVPLLPRGVQPIPSWTNPRGGARKDDEPAGGSTPVMDALDRFNPDNLTYMCGLCVKWYNEDGFRAHRSAGGTCPKAPTAPGSASKPTSSGGNSSSHTSEKQTRSDVGSIAARTLGAATGPAIHVFTHEDIMDVGNEVAAWLALRANFRTFKVDLTPQSMADIPSGLFGWPSALD